MLENILDYEVLGIILGLSMLIVASIIDIWKREIHDYYWIGFGIAGFLLVFINQEIFPHLLKIGFALIIAPFVIFVWRVGLFGGADAFALIALAVIAPMATFSENPVSPFSTLSNAAILFVMPFLTNILRNTIAILKKENIFEGFEETTFKKICATLIGYRAKKPKYCFSIERKDNGKKKISLSMHHAENEEYCTEPNTWVTPGIPYILLITGGFVIQILYGDFLLNLFFH